MRIGMMIIQMNDNRKNNNDKTWRQLKWRCLRVVGIATAGRYEYNYSDPCNVNHNYLISSAPCSSCMYL